MRHQHWIGEAEGGKTEQGQKDEKGFPKDERVDTD
jgi:hypothetical protein